MTHDELGRLYEAVIRERFPTICIHADPIDRSPCWPPTLHLHCLPDEKAGEFGEYKLDEFYLIQEERGLPDAHVIDHVLSTTRKYHSHVCSHAGPAAEGEDPAAEEDMTEGDVDMERPVDVARGVGGTSAGRSPGGSHSVVLAPDVAAVFKTARAVNATLRSQMPRKPSRKNRTTR